MASRSHDGSVLPSALPIIAAPMAGGPTTPELVAAVSAVGGYGFLAAGYLGVDALTEVVARTRALTAAPFGVNVFVPGPDDADADAVATYANSLAPLATRLGVELGAPRWDDDGYAAKLELLFELAPHTVSFTFGCPDASTVTRLHARDIYVAITVTNPAEARQATATGADVLVVQGAEAGGHQGTFEASAQNGTALRDSLAAVGAASSLPLIAAGAIMTHGDVTAALDAGAAAVQVGTALLCADEAGTSPAHRDALLNARYEATVLTRAFSGRWARGLANRFAQEHPDAPAGYPQLHHLTRPLRSAATKLDDPDVPSLWAGTAWHEVRAAPAGEIVRALAPTRDRGR